MPLLPPSFATRRRPWATGRSLLAGLVLAASVAACSNIEKAKPQPAPVRAQSFDLNVPRMMRGTIASEAVLLGYDSSIVRGYGLVVGLRGTGSRNVPPALRAHMLSEMARRGVGRGSSGFGHIKPERMLDSLDTAVVIVEGIVPPGAVGRQVTSRSRVVGTRFDVRVYADPRTDTTSIEGGRLYTAELRAVQPGETLPPTGSRQSAVIAEASGSIFVNPFADPTEIRKDSINRTIGRIMDGGEVLTDMPLKLRLSTPSHTRAQIMQSAINSRFPQEPGQADPTARGESEAVVRITVPTSYRERPDEFVEILRHTTIRQSGVEAVANSIKRLVMNDPYAADAASWRWQALGQRALPAIEGLYDYPEELPRLAALRAGAKLDDAMVIPHLIEMARSASPDSRRQAVALLGDMRLDPRIDRALRELLSDEDVDVRLAAYEAQTKRLDPYVTRYAVDGKFVLDVLDSDRPMIYVAQVGTPRVAVFGRDLALQRPLVIDAWAGRLLLKTAGSDDLVDVYYRPDTGDRMIERTDARLDSFVQFLGHTSTVDEPEPGLGLSYAEVVGALYQIWQQEGLAADFKAEQDRVLAAIRRQRERAPPQERPEFSDPDFDFLRAPEDAEPAEDGPPTNLSEVAAPPTIGHSGLAVPVSER